MKERILSGVLLLCLLLTSCNRQDEINEQSTLSISTENQKKVETMKNFSKLLGKFLKEKENRAYLENLIIDRNDNSEAISVNTLLGKNIPVKESELLRKSKSFKKSISNSNPFKQFLIKELKNNLDDYPTLKAELTNIQISNLKNKNSAILSESENDFNEQGVYERLSNFLVEQELDVYFPYEENFVLSEEDNITLTWDPMTGQDTNNGYILRANQINNVDNNFTDLTPIDVISDDYAYQNPTLVVRPIGWIGDEIEIEESIDDFIPTPPSGSSNAPTWEFKGWQGFLEFNIDHTKIKDEDILKVNIPKIRLTEQFSTFLTPSTITIVRSSANLTTDANNNLVYPLSPDSKHVVTKMNIKRKQIRKGQWIDVNIIWDDDWNMHEVEHNLTWGSHHTFAGSLNASGKVKLGWDKKNKKATFEPTIDVDFNVKVGNNCKLRYNNNISRRAVLTQIVGNTGAGTINDGGVNYSIRTAGSLQYYFKPYLTKITQ